MSNNDFDFRKQVIEYIVEHSIVNRDMLREVWAKTPIEGMSRESVEKEFSIFKQYCTNLGDNTLQESNQDFKRLAIKWKDINTYNNKTFRDYARSINALEQLNQDLLENIGELKPRVLHQKSSPKVNIPNNNDILMVQLSDLHFSEVVNEQFDRFDFTVLSKRLKKFANIVKQEQVLHNYKKIFIAITGDLINNDVIPAKLLNNSCNKAKAILLAVDILEQFILDIKSVCDNIVVAFTAGNESRIDVDYNPDSSLITNNCDFIVFNILEKILGNTENIKFIKGFANELIVNVNGNNILLTHGVAFSKGDIEKAIAELIGKYSIRGVNIRYVIFGHIHCQRNSSMFSRSGGIVGNNAYSDKTLNLMSRASQNIYIVSPDGSIHTMGIDLEEYTDDMYEVIDKLNDFGDTAQRVLPSGYYEIQQI